MRKTVLAVGTVIFIVVECFLIRLILQTGPDSKEFYTTPISELGKPLNDMLFHQENNNQINPVQGSKRRPASQIPKHEAAVSSMAHVYPITITYDKVEKYLHLDDPLPGHENLYPIYGAIVRNPRQVTKAPGEFLGFYFGQAIFVQSNPPARLIRQDEGMMVFVSARTHTFFLAPGTICVIFKDFNEVAEVAAEYQITLQNRLTSLKTAIFIIPVGTDVFALLKEMQDDPRFVSVTLDLITDLRVRTY